MRHAGVAVLVVGVCAAGCGGHARVGGTIVFGVSVGVRAETYAVRPDGTGLMRLPAALSGSVSWTRDGTKALVLDYTNGETMLASVYDATRGTKRRLPIRGVTTGSAEVDLTETPWSPDGTRVVLATTGGDVVVDVRTGKRRHIHDEESEDLLAWSGDGKALLFPAGHDVVAAPADGGPAARLMRLRLEPSDLQSSSDGKWISFEHYYQDDSLYVVRANGTGLRRVAPGGVASAWSPTGDRVAFADSRGYGLVDLASGRRIRLTHEPLDDPANEGPAWSPDGREILYRRIDLAGADPREHMQLWRMKADGTDRHPVTHALPLDWGIDVETWVDATLKGRPVPRPPLVSFPAARVLTTRLPIVGLAAQGDRAAVAQGFGRPWRFHSSPRGPIVVWNTRASAAVPVHGCVSVYDVLLAGGRVGYVCDNSSGEGYDADETLRLGAAELVHTQGGEFTGTFLRGEAADGRKVVYAVGFAEHGVSGHFWIDRTRIWQATPSGERLVRTVNGNAFVASLDAGRIAIVRRGKSVSVLAGHRMRTFAFRAPRILGVARDGQRLVVLHSRRLTVVDVRTGRRSAWPVRRGFGSDPELEDADGDLAAYAVGAELHLLRLSDGRDVVIDTPNATAPVFARFVPRGLFYAYNKAYAKRPGRLVFVPRAQVEHATRTR